jgi:hypothetical protein
VATTLFTDEPLAAKVTIIRAAHIVELRKAVDAVRIAVPGGAGIAAAEEGRSSL